MVHSGRIAVAIGGDVYGCDGQERVVRLCRVVERWVPAGFRLKLNLVTKRVRSVDTRPVSLSLVDSLLLAQTV